MSAYALINGVLFRPAEQKTSSKTGRVFVSATLKVGGESGDAEFWQITAFSQSVQSELLRLGAGDALSAQGKLKVELWRPRDGGEVKISRSIFADQILALKAPPKERTPKAAKPPTSAPQGNIMPSSAPPFDDDVPFAPEFR